MDINLLRQQIRTQRNALGSARQALSAGKLGVCLRKEAMIKEARYIGLYLPNDGEIDPGDFMHWAFTQAKHCFLPVLDSGGKRTLKFAEITPTSEFTPNRFGIPEPVVDPRALVEVDKLDVILMPLVAIDMGGNRIGMGGGFYDRTLAFIRQQPYDQRPKLVGLAHEFQLVETITPASWDIPLDGVVTDKRTLYFQHNQN